MRPLHGTGADVGGARVFRPPNHLKRKLGRGAPTLPRKAMAAYEGLMAEKDEGYMQHLDRQIRDLRRLAVEILDVPAIVSIGHQIRGEAPSFGYGGVGGVADSLCAYVEAEGHLRNPSVIGLHVDAMAMLKADADVRGDAAATASARPVLEELARAVHHVLRPGAGRLAGAA